MLQGSGPLATPQRTGRKEAEVSRLAHATTAEPAAASAASATSKGSRSTTPRRLDGTDSGSGKAEEGIDLQHPQHSALEKSMDGSSVGGIPYEVRALVPIIFQVPSYHGLITHLKNHKCFMQPRNTMHPLVPTQKSQDNPRNEQFKIFTQLSCSATKDSNAR